jgi:hypothetical protein
MSRTAAQILTDVSQGELDAGDIKVRETARLLIRDVETGETEERVLAQGTRTVTQHDGQIRIS